MFKSTVFVLVCTIAFVSGSIVRAKPVDPWADPIPVTDKWFTIEKALNDHDFLMLRRYGFLLQDASQPIPNLFILYCPHDSNTHYPYLNVTLPKNFPIASFPRGSWKPQIDVRVITDEGTSLSMSGEFRSGELDLDYSPQQADTFLKVIRSKNLAIGFGSKNDILTFNTDSKVTSVFLDILGKQDKTATGQIDSYTTDDVVQACLLKPPAPVARGDNSATVRVPLVDVGGVFQVPVTINGAISLNFLVDSGAADVSIPIDVFSTLVRAGTITDADITGSSTYVTATGDKTELPTFVIRSLKVGRTTIHNVSGSVAPAQGSLLLGQSFLKRFKSWSMDNTAHELVLQ